MNNPVASYEDARTLGESLGDLADDQAEWSQRTFGTDNERGPIGALKHLALEAEEAQASPHDRTEYADCLLLVLDASRRAGFTPLELVQAAKDKLEICKTRQWHAPQPNEPVERER